MSILPFNPNQIILFIPMTYIYLALQYSSFISHPVCHMCDLISLTHAEKGSSPCFLMQLRNTQNPKSCPVASLAMGALTHWPLDQNGGGPVVKKFKSIFSNKTRKCHRMEMISAILDFYEGNPPMVYWSFYVYFVVTWRSCWTNSWVAVEFRCYDVQGTSL